VKVDVNLHLITFSAYIGHLGSGVDFDG
jgi:hypothetical protein